MRRASPKRAQPTEKLNLSLTRELKNALQTGARDLFGDRKGAVSIYAEMLLRKELNMKIEGVTET